MSAAVELSPTDPRATVCGDCGRGWDDSVVTSVTPTPAARCPFEYDHEQEIVPESIAQLSGKIRESIWTGSDFPDLSGADLSGADLSDIDLWKTDLSGANLRGANLRGSGLRGADLSGADLSGADLRETDLRDVNFNGANLTGADLFGADMSGAYR